MWLDPFGEPEVDLESKKPVKKVKPSSDGFLNSALPLDNINKSATNEVTSLKKLLQFSEKPREPEKKPPSDVGAGLPKPKNPEMINRPKKPNYPAPPAAPPMQQSNQGNINWGAGVSEGNFITNKLKFLPHVQYKESSYGNSVVPVLPSFLTE